MSKVKYFFLVFITQNIFADNTTLWNNAYQAYQKSNIAALQDMANTNANDQIVNYLFAANSLDKSNPNIAAQYVAKNPTNFLDIDINHKLLNFYFSQQDWNQYIKYYKLMPTKQTSSNETCGYELANYALNNKIVSTINPDEILRNKMPLWCVSLIASKISNGDIAKNYKVPFLYNLIVNNQLSQFNQIAPSLGINNVNFAATTPANQATSQYQLVYRIANLSIKTPDVALAELNSIRTESFTQNYLANIVATNLAIKQMFVPSQIAFKNSNNQFLSDDGYEWQVRANLALSNWAQVLKTINAMPEQLQNKNVWIYWKAFAMSQLGQRKSAQTQLKKIPAGYNFYSLLAQAELNTQLNIKNKTPASKFGNLQYQNDINTGFALYALGKQINSSLYTKLGTQILYSNINVSNDSDIAAISDKAYSLGMNDIAIYAGTKISKADASRSFPMLYVDLYRKYSALYNVDPIFPIAITRQESRFVPTALAFDGGVGLMQIMPATAASIARSVGSTNCYKQYECNIQFGTWFLAHLAQKFDGNLIYASAGYNAGPGRAHRWQQAFSSLDNRVQIELIPFKITRDYAQKIITNKLVYDAILENDPLNMNDYLKKINNKDTVYITDNNDNTVDTSAPISGADDN